MSRPGWRSVLLALGFVVGASPEAGFGQTVSADRWTLAAEGLGGYQSNVYGTVPPQGDYATRLALRLERRFKIQRLQLGAGLGVGTILYSQLTEYNHLTWDVGLSGTWNLSRRTVLDGRATTSFDYGGDTAVPADPAIPPDTLRRHDSAAASLRHSFSRTLEGTLDVSAGRYEFESSSLLDGWRFTAGAGLVRSWSGGTQLSAVAEYERTATYGPAFEIERVLLGVDKPLNRQLSVAARGGLARYRPLEAPSPVEASLTPTGGVDVKGAFGRHTVSVGAARVVGQTFGLGAIGVSRVLSVAYGVSLGSRLALALGANDVRLIEGVAGAPGSSRSRGAQATLTGAVTRRLRAHVTYVYWQYLENTPDAEHHAVWGGVQHSFAW